MSKQKTIARAMTRILSEVGEDISRPGLQDTPKRFAKSFSHLLSGSDHIDLDPKSLFAHSTQELIVIKDIEFYSLCEHHVLPFFGKAHIAYIPNGKIIGLSKVPRIIDTLSKRLNVQESLTAKICSELDRILKPNGILVILEASHLCMMMRGVRKQHSVTLTQAVRGVLEHPDTKQDAMRLIQGSLV